MVAERAGAAVRDGLSVGRASFVADEPVFAAASAVVRDSTGTVGAFVDSRTGGTVRVASPELRMLIVPRWARRLAAYGEIAHAAHHAKYPRSRCQ